MAEQQESHPTDPLSPSARAATPRAQGRPHGIRDRGNRKHQAQRKSPKRRDDSKSSGSAQTDLLESLSPGPACAAPQLPASQNLSPQADAPHTFPAPHRHTGLPVVPRGTPESKVNSPDIKDRSPKPAGAKSKSRMPPKALPLDSKDETAKPVNAEGNAQVPWKPHFSDPEEESPKSLNVEGNAQMPWKAHPSHSKDEIPKPVSVEEQMPEKAYSSGSSDHYSEPVNIEGRVLMPWMAQSLHSKDENQVPVAVAEKAEPVNVEETADASPIACTSSLKNEVKVPENAEGNAQPEARDVEPKRELPARSPSAVPSPVSPLLGRFIAVLTRSPKLHRTPTEQASDDIFSQEGNVPALPRRKSSVRCKLRS